MLQRKQGITSLGAMLSLFGLLSLSVHAQECNPNMPASTPDDRFNINTDGTVTDTQTGLIWQRCLVSQSGADCSGSASNFDWQQALQYAVDQGSNWRLPNIKELASIVELRCYNPAINLNIFPNHPNAAVWSDSPNAEFLGSAWYVDFNNGGDSWTGFGIHKHIRLVRDGQ